MTQQKVREMFDEIDDDRNGFVDEFQQLIEKIGIPFSKKEVEQVFSVIDDEDGGSIDEDEFWEFLNDETGGTSSAQRLRGAMKGFALGTQDAVSATKNMKLSKLSTKVRSKKHQSKDQSQLKRGMSMDLPEQTLAELNRETYIKLERTCWVALPYSGEGQATAIPIFCPSLLGGELRRAAAERLGLIGEQAESVILCAGGEPPFIVIDEDMDIDPLHRIYKVGVAADFEDWRGITLDAWGAAEEVRSIVDGYKAELNACIGANQATQGRLAAAEEDLNRELEKQQGKMRQVSQLQTKLYGLHQSRTQTTRDIDEARIVRRRLGVLHNGVTHVDMNSKKMKEVFTWEPMTLETHDGVLVLKSQALTDAAGEHSITIKLLGGTVTDVKSARRQVSAKSSRRNPKHVRHTFTFALEEPETRMDSADGVAYTQQQFQDQYIAGWQAEWDASVPTGVFSWTFAADDEVTLQAWVACFEANTKYAASDEVTQEETLGRLTQDISAIGAAENTIAAEFDAIKALVTTAAKLEEDAQIADQAASSEAEESQIKFDGFCERHKQWLDEERRLQYLRGSYEQKVVSEAEGKARKEADKIAREEMSMDVSTSKWDRANKLTRQKSSVNESYDGFNTGKKKFFGRFSSDGGQTDRYNFLKSSHDDPMKRSNGGGTKDSWDGPQARLLSNQWQLRRTASLWK